MYHWASPPSGEQLAAAASLRLKNAGNSHHAYAIPADQLSAALCTLTATGMMLRLGKTIAERRERSYRTCWRPKEDLPEYAPPRDSGAYVPQLAARLDDDRNLNDGARHCGRDIARYVYRKNRNGRSVELTVTYLMKSLRKSRRTVQRYLRQLERAGYITVHVIHHAGTRMCGGLRIDIASVMLPRHGWPLKKSMKPDAPLVSQKDRETLLKKKKVLIPRALWAIRCLKPIEKAWDRIMPPLTPLTLS